MSKPSREERVKSAALETGFSLVGISAATPHPVANETFDRWLKAGKHAGMSYLKRHREKRREPAQILDGAVSVICVGLNYYQEIEKEQRGADVRDGRGVFSIYAHSRDYHLVMEEKLGRLAGRLARLFPGVRTESCVDTRPVSDRSMALRAGIGWLGKNSSVISPEYGSWIFLGEIFTDLELKPDSSLETLCAKCTRCIDSCPTGALEVPFVVDARKCISYLTIEHRGGIPAQLQPNIGLLVYGCDTCQSVCPFNKVAKQTDSFDRDERSPLVDMRLEALEDISDDKFRELTVNSAIRRCKPEGLRRNARIVRNNAAAGSASPNTGEEKPKT